MEVSMDKRWSFASLIAGLPAVLCFASMTVAGPALADCRTQQTQVTFDQSWDDPRPSTIQTAADIHVWKTLTLGTYREFPTLRVALDQAGCAVGDDVDAMLDSGAFPLARTPVAIDLVVVSVAQLGFPRDASRAAIFARAKELGLQLCPPEVGPLLRLQYVDQPIGELLRIAMEPVRMANGELDDMIVGNGGASLSVVGTSVRPDQTLSWNVVLVFAQKSARNSTAYSTNRF
jgi:hypothetical protein